MKKIALLLFGAFFGGTAIFVASIVATNGHMPADHWLTRPLLTWSKLKMAEYATTPLKLEASTYIGFYFELRGPSPMNFSDALRGNFWCEGRIPKIGGYIRWKVTHVEKTETVVRVFGCYETTP